MQLIPRLFVGGYRELRRPENVVDEVLMRRIEDARQRLRLEGKDVKAVREVARHERQRLPYRPRARVFDSRWTVGH